MTDGLLILLTRLEANSDQSRQKKRAAIFGSVEKPSRAVKRKPNLERGLILQGFVGKRVMNFSAALIEETSGKRLMRWMRCPATDKRNRFVSGSCRNLFSLREAEDIILINAFPDR